MLATSETSVLSRTEQCISSLSTLWGWLFIPVPWGIQASAVHFSVRCLFWHSPVHDLPLVISRQLSAQCKTVLNCSIEVRKLPVQLAETSKCFTLDHYQETFKSACISVDFVPSKTFSSATPILLEDVSLSSESMCKLGLGLGLGFSVIQTLHLQLYLGCERHAKGCMALHKHYSFSTFLIWDTHSAWQHQSQLRDYM